MGNCPYSSSMVGKESCLCIDDIKVSFPPSLPIYSFILWMCVRYEGMNNGDNSTTVNVWDISPITTQSPIMRKKEKIEKAFGYKVNSVSTHFQ